MTAIVGADIFTATCVGPDPGTATHTSVNDLGEHLANRTIWLKNRAIGSLRHIETAKVVGSTLSLLRDLKTSTTYLDISGVALTLSNSILADDIVIVRASAHVKLECDVSPTNHVAMALALEGVEVGGFTLCSSEGPTFLRAHSDMTFVAVGTITTPTFQLRGKCSTAANINQAEVYGPYDLTVMHLRPIAAP